jgi:OOP family OmpA-OmpF porin
MNKKKSFIILFLLLLASSTLSRAGDKNPLDFRIGVGLNRNALNINSNLDFSPSTSINYNISPFVQADYYFSTHFGFGLGIEYNRNIFLNSLSNYSHNYSGIDNWEGDPVARNYEFFIESNNTDIEENTAMQYVNVPFSVVYKHPLTSKSNLITRAGLKIGFPLSGNYRLESSNLKTRLYFEEWDLELFDIPAHGLYESRTDWHPEGNTALAVTSSAFAELGAEYQLTPGLNSRISAYASLGLNDIINESQNSLIYWRNTYNSMLTLTDKVSLHQIGLRLSFSYRKVKKEPVRGHELPVM